MTPTNSLTPDHIPAEAICQIRLAALLGDPQYFTLLLNMECTSIGIEVALVDRTQLQCGKIYEVTSTRSIETTEFVVEPALDPVIITIKV